MFDQLANFFPNTGEVIFIQLLVVWSLVFKGLALWQAARIHKKWFVALLVLNTVGILEIVYLLFFSPTPYIEKLKNRFPKLRLLK